MRAQGFVFDIGDGCGYACSPCKDITEDRRAEMEAAGHSIPEFYGARSRP